MAINTRSPYYISINDAALASAELELYIWTGDVGDQPASTQYTLTKNIIVGKTEIAFEISELIRDYIDITYDGGVNCVWFAADIYAYDSTGGIIDAGSESQFAFDSYSYFEETSFNVENTSVMMSNRKIFALADNLVRIPINTRENPTVTFLNNGNIVGSESYSSSNNTTEQIKYVTLNGVTDYDNYLDRVLEGGGTFENNTCLKSFLDEFEIGEADKIVISNDNDNLQTIDVKVLDECKYEPKKVTFVNKFGALQEMYFFKKSVEKMTVKKESYKANILNGTTYNRTHHVNREFNVIGNESVTLSSGYLSEDYNEVFKQLLLSEKVWMTNLTETQEQVLPINVKTSNITYKTSLNDRLVEYTIEFDKSFDTINNIR